MTAGFVDKSKFVHVEFTPLTVLVDVEVSGGVNPAGALTVTPWPEIE